MTTLTWLLAVIGVVTFLGAVVVFLRGSSDQGTIRTLKDSNAALIEHAQVVDADNVRKEAQILALTARVDALERENAVLRTVDGAAEKMVELHHDLDAHHKAAMKGLHQLHGDLMELPPRITAAIKEAKP